MISLQITTKISKNHEKKQKVSSRVFFFHQDSKGSPNNACDVTTRCWATANSQKCSIFFHSSSGHATQHDTFVSMHDKYRNRSRLNCKNSAKFFALPGKMCWTQFKKFRPLSEKSSPHLVSQAGYGPGTDRHLYLKKDGHRLYVYAMSIVRKSP